MLNRRKMLQASAISGLAVTGVALNTVAKAMVTNGEKAKTFSLASVSNLIEPTDLCVLFKGDKTIRALPTVAKDLEQYGWSLAPWLVNSASLSDKDSYVF